MKDTTGIKLINPYLYYRDLFRSLRDSIATAEFGKTSAQFLGLVFLTLPMIVYSMFTFPFVNFQDLNDNKSAEPGGNERPPINSEQLNAASNQFRDEAEEIQKQIKAVLKSDMNTSEKSQKMQTLSDKAKSINNKISSLSQQKNGDVSARQGTTSHTEKPPSPNAQQASIQDQGSRLQDQGSRLQDQGTSIKAQVARIRVQKEKYGELALKLLNSILEIENSPEIDDQEKSRMQGELLGKLDLVQRKVDNLAVEMRNILSKHGFSGTLNENNAVLNEELNELLSQDAQSSGINRTSGGN